MVRCADCGLVCVRHSDKRSLDEVEIVTRQNGKPVVVAPLFPGRLIHERHPLCFVMKFDLVNEWSKESDNDYDKRMLNILTKSRDCSAFVQWHQGFTPKEHKQMMFDLEAKKLDMENRQRDRRWDLIVSMVSAVVGAFIGALATWAASKS